MVALASLADLVGQDTRMLHLPLVRDLIAGGSEHYGHRPSCETCASPACCNQAIRVHLHEALPIALRLRREHLDCRPYRERLRAVGEEMEGCRRKPLQARDDWFALARPCVFLDDGRCSVYTERPLICRRHFTWSPAAECTRADGRVAGAEVPEERYQQHALARTFREHLGIPENGRALLGALPRMVALVLEAMASERPFADHVAGEPFPADAEQREWWGGANPFGRAR